MSMPLGAIADDLTGATDLAIMLTDAGYETVVVPEEGTLLAEAGGATRGAGPDGPSLQADAIVVALKTRTAPPGDAVGRSLAAVRWLRQQGCGRFYFKYCSTFDSTPQGNIGPVAEALMDELGTSMTVVVPSFPAAGRTVYQGNLFVHEKPLHESSLRDHPLTPMRDSNLIRLLQPQLREGSRIALLPLTTVMEGTEAVRDGLRRAEADGARYVVVDAVTDEHLRTVARAASGLTLLTGGSGLAQGLAGPRASGAISVGPARGRRITLAGSASKTTQAQVRHALERGRGIQLDLNRLREDVAGYSEALAEEILAGDPADAVTVYATASPEDLGSLEDAPLIEECLARVARALSQEESVQGLVVAGGETSGAVIEALGIRSLRMGRTLDPGVAWALAERGATGGEGDSAEQTPPLPLVLKSGNFGGEDLLTRAWDMKA